jgi:putative Mg2+ transporter-C (MgtC) family protein
MHETLIMVGKLVLAGILGGVVGYEREVHEHPAGLRTHIIVCIGSALITIVSVSFHRPDGDPTRIAAQIVSGIGFLGAGTILRQGSIVRGLTTAASLWTVSGIGIAVGVGGPNGIFCTLSVVATLIVFLTLSIMRGFEPGLGKRAPRYIRLELVDDTGPVLGQVLQQLLDLGADVQAVHSTDVHLEGRKSFRLKVVLPRRLRPDAVVAMLANQSGVERFDWS